MFPGLRRLKRITNYAVNKKHNNNNEETKENEIQVKRRAEHDEDKPNKRKAGGQAQNEEKKEFDKEEDDWDEVEEGYQYEDKFDDEYEKEEILNPEAAEKDPDEDWEEDELEKNLAEQFSGLKFSDTPVIYQPAQNKKPGRRKSVTGTTAFLGTDKDLQEDEALEYDNEAYDLFHRMTTDWPCLSFDILQPENKPLNITGQKQQIITYPLTVYSVAGSQAEPGQQNYIYYMKWSQLHKTKYDDDSDGDAIDADDVDNEAEGKLETLQIRHPSPVNRIRSMNGTGVVAVWSEDATLTIYNGTQHLQNLADFKDEDDEWEDEEDDNRKKKNKSKVPAPFDKNNFVVSRFKHKSEGYALQWSPLSAGLLATGDCDANIHFYKLADENGSEWIMDTDPFVIHAGSVEDIQFSPNEVNVCATCGTDGTIKFIDFRANQRNQFSASIKASKSDINVISWNSVTTNLIASGADDGTVSVWDIRYLNKSRSIAEIQFHKEAITSIDFQPFEESVVAVGSADNRVSIWDFSVEADLKNKDEEIPDQLMFIHQGIQDVKEVKHHPAYSDVVLTTALNGFNIFKPNYEMEVD